MEHVEGVLKTAMAEIERLLNTKTIVGEPQVVEGNTLIPLVSFGFGFGAGGGSGEGKSDKGSGSGVGTGGAGGIKPVAIIVVNKDGVTIAPIVGGAATAVEKVGEIIGKAIEHRVGKKKAE